MPARTESPSDGRPNPWEAIAEGPPTQSLKMIPIMMTAMMRIRPLFKHVSCGEFPAEMLKGDLLRNECCQPHSFGRSQGPDFSLTAPHDW